MHFIALLTVLFLTQAVSTIPTGANFNNAEPQSQAKDSIMTRLQKRQWDLQSTRSAYVDYHCPVSGDQERTFKWRALYDRSQDHIEMANVLNIDSFDHVERVTNDFATTWEHRYSRAWHAHCCMYIVKGTVIGEIFDNRISMGLAAVRRAGIHGVTVTEICIESVRDHVCPSKTFVLQGLYSTCEVTDSVVLNG